MIDCTVYTLYHIHEVGNDDISQGYVGVTKHLETRIQQHEHHGVIFSNPNLNLITDVIATGSLEEMAIMEYNLRPFGGMGLNNHPGGKVDGYTHQDWKRGLLQHQLPPKIKQTEQSRQYFIDHVASKTFFGDCKWCGKSKPVYVLRKHEETCGDSEMTFDGMFFETRNEFIKYMIDNGVTRNALTYCMQQKMMTIKEIFEYRDLCKSNNLKSVTESNNRRTGQKLNMKLVKCPQCGKEGKGGNMTRYHFDNCKQRGS